MFHRWTLRVALAGLMLGGTVLPASAKDIIVHMKNKGAEGAMVFEPAFVKAAPGDAIRFQPTDASHNAETMATMLPAGATPMKGGMNKEAVLTVTKSGLYGIKCMPHYSMGMVALIQVGKPTAADIARQRRSNFRPSPPKE